MKVSYWTNDVWEISGSGPLYARVQRTRSSSESEPEVRLHIDSTGTESDLVDVVSCLVAVSNEVNRLLPDEVSVLHDTESCLDEVNCENFHSTLAAISDMPETDEEEIRKAVGEAKLEHFQQAVSDILHTIETGE